MSDKEVLAKYEADVARSEASAKTKRTVDEKALLIREHKVSQEYERFQQAKKETEDAKKVDYTSLSDQTIQKLIEDNDAYMLAAKQSMSFICDTFKGVVPYFRKNLILIGGDTGDGKSTTVANIITETIFNRNPATGKPGKALVLTNEEAPEDFYNRITCHIHGWQYTNHDQFTDFQRATFREMIPKLAKGDRLTVIGDTHEGVSGTTTTFEGIQGVFKSLMDKGKIYDVVLIDYYQNVQFSRDQPDLDQYKCQARFAAILDAIKVAYPGVIVVMAQMKKLQNDEDTTPFNIRLKGAKVICDKATFICELIPERQLLRSKWKVWKSRFTDSVGSSVYTGYDKGRFVVYEGEFEQKVAQLVVQRLEEKQLNELPDGVTDKKKKKER